MSFFHDSSWIGPGLIKIIDNGMILQSFVNQKFTIKNNDPLSATATYKHEHIMKNSKMDIKINVLTTINCDSKYFFYNYFLETYDKNKKFFSKKIKKQILRKGF